MFSKFGCIKLIEYPGADLTHLVINVSNKAKAEELILSKKESFLLNYHIYFLNLLR
jgi:hypothetical protein